MTRPCPGPRATTTRPERARAVVVVDESFGPDALAAMAARCRRLARDHERLPTILAGLHFLAFACRMVAKASPIPAKNA